MPWFELKGDKRLGRCATEGCGGQPIFRLETHGVGSDYCSGCRARIEREHEKTRQMIDADRDWNV